MSIAPSGCGIIAATKSWSASPDGSTFMADIIFATGALFSDKNEVFREEVVSAGATPMSAAEHSANPGRNCRRAERGILRLLWGNVFVTQKAPSQARCC